MKFVSMKKVHGGKFLSRYDIVYETIDGGRKNYEMVSRSGDRTEFHQLHDHDPDPAAEHQQPLAGVFTRYGKQGCQNNQYEHLMPERLLAFPREHEAGQGIFGGSHQMLGIDESGHSFLPFSFQNAAGVSTGYDNCLKYKPLP